MFDNVCELWKKSCVCVCGRHRFLWISRGAILCRSSSPGVESHPDYDRSRSADRGKGQLCSFKKLWVWEEAWSKCFARDLEAFRTLCHKSKLMRLSSTCSKTETKKNRNVLTQTMLRQQRTGARGMCFLVLDQKWSNMYIDIGQGASMCKSLCRHKEKNNLTSSLSLTRNVPSGARRCLSLSETVIAPDAVSLISVHDGNPKHEIVNACQCLNIE